MKYVLVKEGEYRPNVFSDLTETVNQPEAEQVGFFTRMDYALRLVRNRSQINPEWPLAIAHYHSNPTANYQDPNTFRPINTELMFNALETYDYVLFGVITPTHIIKDYGLVSQARYIARNADNKLVDVETGELLNPNSDSVTFLTAFFGMVRVKGLPVYYLIMDPKLLHATDGFDYQHDLTDTKYVLVSDHDGTLRDTVFAPSIVGAQQFGNVLLVDDDYVEVQFFTSKSALRDDSSIRLDNISVSTSQYCEIRDRSVLVQADFKKPTALNIKFNCGKFFEIAHEVEQPVFNYLMLRA